MGPHFFKCGNSRWRHHHQGQVHGLQWGRTFSSAETRKTNTKMTTKIWPSMGPHFFKCGNSAIVRTRPTKDSVCLQWGRTFSSAETGRGKRPRGRGNIFLQWGRTFSSAETREVAAERAGKQKPSMGPHFFKCGNFCWVVSLPRTIATSFNGAALFQVRKRAIWEKLPTWGGVLQWGRTFSSAETLLAYRQGRL